MDGQTATTFGGAGTYYDAALPDDARLFAPENLAKLLEALNPELLQQVERSFKQWNQSVRDNLRSIMGLRLTVGDDAQAVPVKIVAGLPDALAGLFRKFPPETWEFLLRRSLLKHTDEGLGFVVEHYRALESWTVSEPSLDPPPVGLLWTAEKGVERIVATLEKLGIDELLKSIPRDVLGAYFFRVPAIRLYWMAIGLISGLLGIDVEALTVVVAAHELSHAYSHLGRDIDGSRWDTEAFARTDICIVEGLAQFYGEAVCRKLEPRFPAALRAYHSLLENQSGPYRVQESWLKNEDGDDDIAQAGEIIRAAMIQSRVQKVKSHEVFEACVRRYRYALGGPKRRTGGSDPDRAEAASAG